MPKMIHEIIPVGPLQCNCSIVVDESSRESIVIDPGDEIDNVLAVVNKHRLTVKQIVVTHGHIDHVGGAMKLKAVTGAPVLMNEKDQMQLDILDFQASWIGVRPPGLVSIDQSLIDGDLIKVAGLEASVMHTPGHTEGSVCLLFDPQKKLFAGDLLFAGSIGRTDLPGGNYDKLMRSLHEKLLVLPDDIIVVPGHGELTTVGSERKRNPFLQA